MKKSELKKIKNGNKTILANYLIEYSKGFYRIAYAITGNKEDAEDAISSLTIKVCEKINTLQHAEFFKTWAVRILINESKNILRRNSRNAYIDDIENAETTEINYVNVAVKDLINKLDDDFKEIIILYYYDDYSVKEISQILEIAEGTVKSRLARARDELKKMNIEGLL